MHRSTFFLRCFFFLFVLFVFPLFQFEQQRQFLRLAIFFETCSCYCSSSSGGSRTAPAAIQFDQSTRLVGQWRCWVDNVTGWSRSTTAASFTPA